jgi:CheY-like chemotaxis protein
MESASGMDHKLTIRTHLTPSGTVAIDICDTGPGIAEDVAKRVFEPFFTTKPQGSGTGVGLSFSHGVIAAHGGSLTLEPSAEGAFFRIELPPGEADAKVEEENGQAAARRNGRGKALIVDDEGDVADTLRELVEREGFTVTTVPDGAAALRAVDDDHAIIFSDLRMPGMSGPELLRQLREQRPAAAERLAFVTGDTLGSSMADFLQSCGRPVLEKPFTVETVRELIRAVESERAAR